jgi:hypothetical protein
MRLWTLFAAFVLFVFGLALTTDRSPTVASNERVSVPATPSGDCCGDACECCDACPCGVEDEPQTVEAAEDLSSHIGRRVTRASRPGVWIVADAWRDETGQLMYLYRQEQTATAGNCPGGFCPSPSDQLQTGYYDGTSGWTYPGDIAGHLLGGSHGVSQSELVGLSKDQMESLHDSLHDAGGQAVRLQSSSSCPGGVCPQPTRVRRGWFRR